MIGATFDSGVFIRPLHLGGPAALLIGHVRAGDIRIDTSGSILNETLRVLRDRFESSVNMLHETRGKLAMVTNRVIPSETLSVIKRDPDDNRVLECAFAAKSDFIVSEDDELLRLGQFGRARIVSIKEFLKVVLTPGESG